MNNVASVKRYEIIYIIWSRLKKEIYVNMSFFVDSVIMFTSQVSAHVILYK